MKITALREEGRNKGKFRLYLDGRPVLKLEAEVVAEERLSVSRELTEPDINRLLVLNEYQRCLKAALHYLSFRPRSEFEVRTRLRQRGFDSQNIDSAVTRLKEQKLIDDEAFADFWRENREAFSPRSKRMTALELTQKGVARGVIDEAVSALDDSGSAYRMALAKARKLPRTDYKLFRSRLGGYLKRRGFSYEVISNTVEKLWRELSSRATEVSL